MHRPFDQSGSLGKVEMLFADATSKGARIITGGHRHAMGGTYYEPTVLAGVLPSMQISQEEIVEMKYLCFGEIQ